MDYNQFHLQIKNLQIETAYDVRFILSICIDLLETAQTI